MNHRIDNATLLIMHRGEFVARNPFDHQCASYIPERASQSVPLSRHVETHDWKYQLPSSKGIALLERPLLIFESPQAITVLAEVPDGPPVRFEWRRMSRRG